MLEQGREVASEEGIHVHPYAAIPPDHQQPDQVAVKPRLLIAALQQRAVFERCAPGELTHVRDAKLERVRIPRGVAREQRVAGEVAVGPHDEARVARVLRREERLERVFLSLAERRQVGAPIRVVVRARSVWRERCRRHGANGAGKVVAVEAETHGHAGVDVGVSGAVQPLADVVRRGDLVGLEAAAQGRDGLDLLPDPRTPVEGDFDVGLPGEVGEEQEEQNDRDRVLDARPRARPARSPAMRMVVVRSDGRGRRVRVRVGGGFLGVGWKARVCDPGHGGQEEWESGVGRVKWVVTSPIWNADIRGGSLEWASAVRTRTNTLAAWWVQRTAY